VAARHAIGFDSIKVSLTVEELHL